MAALTAVAMDAKANTELGLACTMTAVACAKWLENRDANNPTSSARPKVVCSREEEEHKRAIGLKKCVKKAQDARGNEPAKRRVSPRDDEPGDTQDSSKENELGESKPTGHDAENQKRKKDEVVRENFMGETSIARIGGSKGYVEANDSGQAQSSSDGVVMTENYDALWPLTAVLNHHCPTGCPSTRTASTTEAMSSSHGGPKGGELHGADDGEMNRDVPWNQAPPAVKSQDQWNFVQCSDRQFWVKVHHTTRVRPFHPLRRSQPFDAELIENKRVTVKFFAGESPRPQKIFDKWTGGDEAHDRRPKGEERWLGYTFFEIKEEKRGQWEEQRIPQSFRGEVHREVQAEELQAKGKGSPLVAVYGSRPTIELADHVIIGGEHTPSQVYGRGKGYGEEGGRRPLQRGYAKGGATQRGEAAMTQGPITRGSQTEGTANPQSSSDEWGFVNGE